MLFSAKEKFLDRVEQSFGIFIHNWKFIVLPVLFFNIITLVVTPYIIALVLLNIFPISDIFSENPWDISAIIDIAIIAGAIIMTLIIPYVLFLVSVQISVIKAIKESILGNDVTISSLFQYSFSHLFQSFKTYWYIFSYTLLLPSLIFIAWGILLNIGLYFKTSSTEVFTIIWWSLMWISVILALFFFIYRGTKSTFALVSAIDKDEFTKDNFSCSVSLTDNKWWRIFWNIFGVAFLWWLLISLIGGIGESLAFFGNDWSRVSQIETQQQELLYALESLAQFNIFYLLNSIFQTTLSTVLWVFISVFTYVFFKRLEVEKVDILKDQPIEEEKIETTQNQEL